MESSLGKRFADLERRISFNRDLWVKIFMFGWDGPPSPRGPQGKPLPRREYMAWASAELEKALKKAHTAIPGALPRWGRALITLGVHLRGPG